jgi:hypothetical protein
MLVQLSMVEQRYDGRREGGTSTAPPQLSLETDIR